MSDAGQQANRAERAGDDTPRSLHRLDMLLNAMWHVEAALAHLVTELGDTDEPLKRETETIQSAYTHRRLALYKMKQQHNDEAHARRKQEDRQ